MKRIFLFLATNIAVLAVLSNTLRLLGIEHLFVSHPPLEERIAALRSTAI